MPSSRYHRKQAEILAGLALSTDDATKAEQFKLAAMEQLDRAQSAEDAEPIRRPGSAAAGFERGLGGWACC